MRCYLFTDLDDTLFQTLRKHALIEQEVRTELLAAAFAQDGQPLSYMNAKQRFLLSLFDTAHIIPVSARNLNAFQRVHIPFTHGAVLNYGATILGDDGQEDDAWKACMLAKLAPYQEEMRRAYTAIVKFAEQHKLAVRLKIIGIDACHFYIVIKNVDANVCFLEKIKEQAHIFFEDIKKWHIHKNSNNLAFIPKVLNKSYAVEHIIKNRIAPQGNDYVTFGMGDSMIDLGFMNLCDYILVPKGSQIQEVALHV